MKLIRPDGVCCNAPVGYAYAMGTHAGNCRDMDVRFYTGHSMDGAKNIMHYRRCNVEKAMGTGDLRYVCKVTPWLFIEVHDAFALAWYLLRNASDNHHEKIAKRDCDEKYSSTPDRTVFVAQFAMSNFTMSDGQWLHNYLDPKHAYIKVGNLRDKY